jgi:hypothetical protein
VPRARFTFASCVPLLLLGGCLGETADTVTVPKEDGTTESGYPTPRPGLGALYVVVTTTEMLPVRSAQVVVADTSLVALTDAAGRVVFNDVEPGSYTLLAAKPGYRALQDKGRIARVASDEVSEVRLGLDPAPVVTAEHAYNKTHHFRGFISCAWDVKLHKYNCGRGKTVAGQNVGRDPNENSVHVWQLDNIQLQTVVSEAVWTPTGAGLGAELYVGLYSHYSCNLTSCSTSNEVRGVGGRSPVSLVIHEGVDQNLTKRFSRTASSYPRNAYSEVKAYCAESCTAMAAFQQNYELYVTVFYAQEAPPGWSALPK